MNGFTAFIIMRQDSEENSINTIANRKFAITGIA